MGIEPIAYYDVSCFGFVYVIIVVLICCEGIHPRVNFILKVKVKLSLCLTKHHAMKTYGRVEV
jgi:hypothetical protein